MSNHTVLNGITAWIRNGRGCYWILLDPDHFSADEGARIAKNAQRAGADAVLVGGSLLHTVSLDDFINAVKSVVSIPVILFPGDATQLSAKADAVLFLSLVSGRNPSNLIGEHVKAAPIIKRYGIEPIATAYMLVESGTTTSVEFMSHTRPLPRTKPSIAAAHALAAQYLGMSMVYLEAGSGAAQSVPLDMVKAVRAAVELPLIVGGGIRSAAAAQALIKAGADIIVTGNLLQQKNGQTIMKEIARAVKLKE